MTNQQVVSSDTEFYVYCYKFMESMTACFYERIDKLCIFIQLLLSSAVMADVINLPLIGLTIAIIAAYQLSYSPGVVASHAQHQAVRYAKIIHDLDTLTENEVKKRLKSLESKDSKILLSISKASYIQAGVATGNVQTAEEKFKKLNCIERFIIFIAGGIQK